jgi:triosephosphate isomerase
MESLMRRPFIAGNWKMNTSVEEAVNLVKEMRDNLNSIDSADRVLCPPFISLHAVAQLIRGSSIEQGAQNMYFREKGAFTGEISALMIRPLCKYVILGHSERRQIFGETDKIGRAHV